MKWGIALLALSLMGCTTLERLTSPSSHPAEAQALPDDYTVKGTTFGDYQVVQPVRVVDSSIIVRIKTPTDTDYRTLNQYEFKADPNGTGGGGIFFRHKVDVGLGGFTIYPDPAAPKGTEYEIRSIRTSGSSSLGLY